MTSLFASALHSISQGMKIPTICLLILMVVAMLFCIGSIVAEYRTERRHFSMSIADTVQRIRDADYRDIKQVVASAPLLERQAVALMTVAGNMGLPDEELFALTQAELEKVETRDKRNVNFTDTVAKVAPMLGLMGTLIPLGPGIVAMGQGDVAALSESLLIAFDTTVAGLIVAICALVISRVRKTWYAQYAVVMRSLMTCVLEEAVIAREEGVALPYGHRDDVLAELRALRKKAAAAKTPADSKCEVTA